MISHLFNASDIAIYVIFLAIFGLLWVFAWIIEKLSK